MGNHILKYKIYESTKLNKVNTEESYSLKYWDDVMLILEGLDLSNSWKIKSGQLSIFLHRNGQLSIKNEIDDDDPNFTEAIARISSNYNSTQAKYIILTNEGYLDEDDDLDYRGNPIDDEEDICPVTPKYIQNQLEIDEKEYNDKVSIGKSMIRIMKLDSGIIIRKFEDDYFVIFSDIIENSKKSKE